MLTFKIKETLKQEGKQMLKLNVPVRIHILGKSYVVDQIDFAKVYSGDGE